MIKFTFKPLFILLTLCLFSYPAFSQYSTGGEPVSKLLDISSGFQTKTMPAVDREKLLQVDKLRSSQGDFPFRFGTVFSVNYDLTNSGTWIDLPDGSRIWRLAISCKNAFSVNLFYSDFFMPQGALLYLYNPDKSFLIGAFTELNNQKDGYFATSPTIGETTILEYYEPEFVKGMGRIGISQVVHAYRDLFGILEVDELPCNININCPIGAPWVEQKRSITRLTFIQGSSGYLCTGSLVNNALQDRTLYYLTAEHCSPDNHSSMVFYFNYENPTCYGTGGLMNQTLSGAILKASNYMTDFRLVQINGTMPASYNAYFNGWDRTGVQPTNQVAIHHPGGANKKISKDTDPAQHSNGFGNRLPNGFWQVVWDFGMTEGGSSGCPLYDQNKRVIGQNLGGVASQCEVPQAVWKVFGKFSESWGYGGVPTNQLKSWLDPNNTNINTLDGMNDQTGIAPFTNFTSDTQFLPITGGNVNFFDMTTNLPTTWSWSFPGGNPSSSNVQNPTNINYSSTGAYTVSLTTSNQFGSNTKTVVNYIRVAGVPLNAFTLISPPNLSIIVVSNSDTSRVRFDWQKSSSSPTVKYMFKIKKLGQQTENTYTSNSNGSDTAISLRRNFLDSLASAFGYTGDSIRCLWRAAATNGVDTLFSNSYSITIRSTTIGISQISSEIPEQFKLHNNYPNPFNPKTMISFDVSQARYVSIRVYDVQGREVAVLVNQNLTPGKYNVDFDGENMASGIYFYALQAGNFYQVKKMVMLK